MSDSFKILYQGQIGNSAATLATVPGGKMWFIKRMTAVNTDTSARTFGLFFNGTADANRVTSGVVSLPASGGYWVDDGTYTLEAAGTIAGIASVASKVTLTIFGDEVT